MPLPMINMISGRLHAGGNLDFQDVPISPHDASGPINVLAGAHVAMTVPNLYRLEARRIAVDYASHTAHVEAVRECLAEDLAGLAPVSSPVPFYSTLEARVVDTAQLDGGYWYRNLREPVRFGEVVAALAAEGHRVFVEVSPHPVLGMAVAQAGEDLVAAASLQRGDGGRDRWLTALASAWTSGVEVDWAAVTGDEGRAVKVGLPTYAFQRQHYWPKPVAGRGDASSAGQQRSGHPRQHIDAVCRPHGLSERRLHRKLLRRPRLRSHARHHRSLRRQRQRLRRDRGQPRPL